MIRSQFDKLEIKEQIKFINIELKKGFTLRQITEDINIARSTLRGRFKKVGYVYNKDNNIYIKSDINIKQDIKVSNINKDVSYKNNIKVIGNNKDTIDELNSIKCDIIELVSNKDSLLEMLNNYKNSITLIDRKYLDIDTLPIDLKKDISTKSVKIYKPVYNKFNELCQMYLSIKKQDLISLALYEFYIKYKK